MNEQQATALAYPCRLAQETAHPRFGRPGISCSTVLTVNNGHE